MTPTTRRTQPSMLSMNVLDQPRVREVGVADLLKALAKGWDDFQAMPSHVIFVVVLYPIIGLSLGSLIFGYNALSLLFPLMSGFALVGPFAAVGLYELSRRREQGQATSFALAFTAFHGANSGRVLALGCLLLAIFAAWLVTAEALYELLMSSTPVESVAEFVNLIFGTPRGWVLIIVGNTVGFAFSLATLGVTVVSFPMLLDQSVSLSTAIATSLQVVQKNPRTMLIWGLIVAGVLAAGMIPLFVGLAVALPLLGHASWHLYRRAVENGGC